MKKRPRKRRHKRSTRPSSGQVRQKLGQLSRELRGDAADELELEIAPRPKAPAGEADPGGVPETPPVEDVRHGTIVHLSSGACRVAGDGGEHSCVLPSRFATQQQSAVAVGDEVSFVAHGPGYRLVEVLPRRTVLSRPDPQNPRRERVIAANVDIVAIVVSVQRPPLRPALVDRYLIAAGRGGARTLLVVNKIDLLRGSSREDVAILDTYVDMGVPVLHCSAREDKGLAELREALSGCTAVLVGHSGVGKSSLLNALAPSVEQATGEVSPRYARGRHTTTRARLFEIDGGIRLIDTPGIRELGLWQLEAEELRFFFPDLCELAPGCRFNDCSHTHEPDCAVRAAVAAGRLDAARYATYRRIHDDLQTAQRF